MPACRCGCGQPVTPRREYRQGHDGKHRARLNALLRAELGDGPLLRQFADDLYLGTR